MDIDLIISDIIDGMTYRAIALKYNIPLSTLHDFVSKPEHSARAKIALEISAQTYDEKAEEVLINAEALPVEIQRARELAQHYRWKASKRNPKKYGDKLTLGGDEENPLITKVIKVGYGETNDKD